MVTNNGENVGTSLFDDGNQTCEEILDRTIAAMFQASTAKDVTKINVQSEGASAVITFEVNGRREVFHEIPPWCVPALLERLAQKATGHRCVVHLPAEFTMHLQSDDKATHWRAHIRAAVEIHLQKDEGDTVDDTLPAKSQWY